MPLHYEVKTNIQLMKLLHVSVTTARIPFEEHLSEYWEFPQAPTDNL
jgi:hypothetical protein